MKVTLRDVAKAAGVGISTVSYVLNESGLHKVGAETQQRIREAAAALNYIPNSFARGLRSGKSYLIGVMVPAIDFSFMPEILAGIDHVLAKNKYNMLLCTYNSNEELIEKCALLRQKQVDGLILKTWNNIDPDTLAQCRNHTLPCVMVATVGDYNVPGVWVAPDSMSKLAFDLLYQQNHRSWAICEAYSRSEWVIVMQQLLQEHQLPQHVFAPAKDPMWREKIFDLLPEITAVIAKDTYALEILCEAHKRRIKVPETLSVLAIDGQDIDQYSIPPLTSITQPRGEQGAEAAKLLLQWIDSKVMPESKILQPRLSLRSSICRVGR